MVSYKVDFEPVGRRGECQAEQSILDCSRKLGVGIVSICGGEGLFFCCKIQILSGTVSEPTSIEKKHFSSQELKEGYRLACQTYPTGNLKIRVPAESLEAPQRTQVEGMETEVSLEPPVSSFKVKLKPPSLSDLRADSERLLDSLEKKNLINSGGTIDIDVLRNLSTLLRSYDWEAKVSVRDNEIVAISPGSSKKLGLAVDVGTTKVAGYLIDLESGKTLANKGVMNHQISYGEDVISRMASAKRKPEEALRMKELGVEVLNELASELSAKVKARPEDIVEAVVVGNTAMHHLLLHLPVGQLAMSPYVSVINEALDIKARDVGLQIAAGSYIHMLPNIAGFVGGDHVAMLLATEAWKAEGVVLALDIGTNTEVCLVSNGEMTSVSCASGPAFEGAHIKNGMRAASGAIEHLRIIDDKVEYQTIGEVPPVGLCGSGILDSLAQLYLIGVVDESGRMNNDHPRVRPYGKSREFVLVGEEERKGDPAITITQHDVRELQLAKGAIRAGIQLLLEDKGLNQGDIDRVIIAGAFGTYIDISSALNIGMLPVLPMDRFQQVGNAAGMGAKLALISKSKRVEAQEIAHRVSYIELASDPRFTQMFAQANYLGLYKIIKGRREKIK
jgi:uncharacterized 2Fe-2S/4Fe-4S cluster protein (DUF4445 family)